MSDNEVTTGRTHTFVWAALGRWRMCEVTIGPNAGGIVKQCRVEGVTGWYAEVRGDPMPVEVAARLLAALAVMGWGEGDVVVE